MAPDAPISERMLGNIQSSFPLTVWQLAVVEGKPFTEALTTERFMMTAPLATLLSFMDNRHTSDQNRGTDYITSTNPTFKFTLSNKSGPIPIEKTLDPQDPLFMNFYLPPGAATGDTAPRSASRWCPCRRTTPRESQTPGAPATRWRRRSGRARRRWREG